MPRMRRVNGPGGARAGAGRPATGTSYSAERRRIEKLRTEMRHNSYFDVAKAFFEYTALVRGEIFATIIGMCLFKPGSYNRELIEQHEAEELDRKLTLKVPKFVEVAVALSMLLFQRLSKRQYHYIRGTVNDASQTKILPSYNQVAQTKLICRPEVGVQITEVKATVTVAALVDHTLRRIWQLIDDIDEKLSKSRRQNRALTFIFSYGYDGASGQQRYAQAFRDPANANRTDASMFAATINPLCVKEDGGSIIWRNPVPQSPLFVRPLLLEWERETRAYVERVRDDIQRQINECPVQRFVTPLGKTLITRIKPVLTMIDGKIFNILTNTISRNCPACGCEARFFNDPRSILLGRFRATDEGLSHGCQPLHAWIRVFRHLLNLAYNKPVRVDRARGERAKQLRAAKKREIQAAFRPYGLRIDFPAPNGRGSTMDGNTSRRAFKLLMSKPDLLRVCGLNEELVRRYWVILMCVNNTHWKLNVAEFNTYCMDTYNLYIAEYGWYPLSATIHKLLHHAGSMQERLDLPIGAYNEGAQETTHRMRKEIRRGPTRKNSPENTMTDTFNRCLDMSDPVLSTEVVRRASVYRNTEEQALAELPLEAQNLLEIPGRPARNEPSSSNSSNAQTGRRLGERRSARAGFQPENEHRIPSIEESGVHQNEAARIDVNNDEENEENMFEDEEDLDGLVDENDEHEYDYEYRSDDDAMDEN